MSVFKKLKHLLTKSPAPKQDNLTHTNPANDPQSDYTHLNPISTIFKEWIISNDWTFTHIEPDEDDDGNRLNIFFVYFSGDDFDWKLIVQILEKPQLVTLFGSLDDTIAKEQRLSALALINERSRYLYFGDIELDLSTGELRSKIYLDAEFSRLTPKIISIQVSQLFRLTEICHHIKEEIKQMPTIDTLSQLLLAAQEQRQDQNDGTSLEVTDENGQSFFAPSGKRQ